MVFRVLFTQGEPNTITLNRKKYFGEPAAWPAHQQGAQAPSTSTWKRPQAISSHYLARNLHLSKIYLIFCFKLFFINKTYYVCNAPNSLKTMKKQAVSRKYNVPDADLYMRCQEALRNAHRDQEYFDQYGYGLDRLKGFKALCDGFRSLPDDDELVGDQMISTEKKNQAAENLKTAIRSLMTRVAMKYNPRHGRYRKFGTSKMGDMSDPQLLFCGRRVTRVARAQIDFLEEVGMNERVIQRVLDACAAFETAMNIQQDRLHERDIAVERRVEQGNKLYIELVVLCDIGKDIWAEKDRKKYDQYCLYESNNEQKKARKLAE